ncbi:MAG: poly-gamma-glutamate synthase PgsB [Pseudonocardiaceae bacterium]
MSAAVVSLGVLLIIAVALLLHWRGSAIDHHRRLDQLDVRIHVNGIRGKSTVTRLVAGVLREGGLVTVAKTTGSAARVIGRDGAELPILRRGAATINEQLDVVAEHVTPDVEALVIECTAVRPLYQRYSQEHMVRSDITVITNVRADHQEEMGETLEQIADSLSVTIPRNGILLTAEAREQLRERLRRNAEQRGSRLIYADPGSVGDEDLRGFDYLQFKENVAIGLAIARLLGIRRHVALRGMWKSVPDPGVVRLQTYHVRGKRILWVPMFAANDRESVVLTFERLQAQFPPGATVIGILNNRRDRGRRAELFAQLVPTELARYLDHVVTFGAYQEQVGRIMTDLGYPGERIHLLGETVSSTVDDILTRLADLVPGGDGVLVGLVNIHTRPAELLIEHFKRLGGAGQRNELAESRDPASMPAGVVRMRRAAAHRPGRLTGGA